MDCENIHQKQNVQKGEIVCNTSAYTMTWFVLVEYCSNESRSSGAKPVIVPIPSFILQWKRHRLSLHKLSVRRAYSLDCPTNNEQYLEQSAPCHVGNHACFSRLSSSGVPSHDFYLNFYSACAVTVQCVSCHFRILKSFFYTSTFYNCICIALVEPERRALVSIMRL